MDTDKFFLKLSIDARLEFRLFGADTTSVGAGYTEDWAASPRTVISRAVKGSGIVRFESCKDEFVKHQGDTSYSPAYIKNYFKVISPDGGCYDWSHISFVYMGNIDFLSFFKIPFIFDRKISGILGDMNIELSNILKDSQTPVLSKFARQKIIGFKMLETILSVSNILPEAEESIVIAERLLPLLRELKDNFIKDINIDSMVKYANMSRSRLHWNMKKLLGVSPMEYIRRLRIERARELLFSTELSISEVAYQTGFDDQFHFSRVFKKVCGLSPKLYRGRNTNIL